MLQNISEGKLYILVRRDLPWPVRCVQSCHAAIQWTRDHSGEERASWGDYGPTMVVFGVDSEKELYEWLWKLDGVPFFEPDRAHELTAVAYYGEIPFETPLTLLE